VPPGCGRPVWVDDADFDLGRHLRHLDCPPPGDEQALLELATAVVTEPLPRSRPPWSTVLVTGLAGHAVALVVVLRHVLADGLGGLAVLASLVDQTTNPPSAAAFPRPPPTALQLAADAWLARLRALGRLPAAWRTARASMAAAGGLRPGRPTCYSLLQPTGPRRRLAVARADLAALRAAAHRHGGTVNDAVLAAVIGALHTLLEQRGEAVDTLAVTVPVAGRQPASAAQLGNQLGAMLVVLPATGDLTQRLGQTAAIIRARKASATGSPAIAVVAPLFRTAASLGLYHWFINHQRLWHTLVSNLRGPDQPVCFAGATVSAVIPVAVGDAGNVTANFVVLSYAGMLTITAVADPDHLPDPSTLTSGLQAELDAIISWPVSVPSST
jgi:diacylglycerol O-acyltransferase / wax synthase